MNRQPSRRNDVENFVANGIGMLLLQLPVWFGETGEIIFLFSASMWIAIGIHFVFRAITKRIVLGKSVGDDCVLKD